MQEKNASLAPVADMLEDGFDYLNGKEFWDINKASFGATVKAHREKLPCLILEVERLDAYAFGELFYFFLFPVMFLPVFWELILLTSQG